MPDYYETLKTYMDNEGNIKSGCKEIAQQFKDELRKIQSAVTDQLYDIGEMLVMINRNYGYSWETIPWGKMDEIKIWVRKNYFRRTQLLAPDLHHDLMTMENNQGAIEYKNWFNKHIENNGDY